MRDQMTIRKPYHDEWTTNQVCPTCGAPVYAQNACAGYPGQARLKDGTYYDTIMVCYPSCGGALEYTCANKDCDWWYREPNNRRDKDRMGIRPDWMNQELALYANEEENDE